MQGIFNWLSLHSGCKHRIFSFTFYELTTYARFSRDKCNNTYVFVSFSFSYIVKYELVVAHHLGELAEGQGWVATESLCCSLKGALSWGFCCVQAHSELKSSIRTFTHPQNACAELQKSIKWNLEGRANQNIFLAFFLGTGWGFQNLGYCFQVLIHSSILAISKQTAENSFNAVM